MIDVFLWMIWRIVLNFSLEFAWTSISHNLLSEEQGGEVEENAWIAYANEVSFDDGLSILFLSSIL